MFTIQYIGSFTEHRGDFCVDHPRGLGSYLLLHTRSRGRFWINGAAQFAEPNTWLLLRPQTPHTYRDADGYYADDWIHFASTDPIPEALCDQLIPLGGIVQVDLYIRLICDAHFRGAGDLVVSQLIQTMLDDVHAMFDTPVTASGHAGPLLDLRKRIYAAPALHWSIKDMAGQMMLSAPYFQAQYKRAFGVSPMADVIASRIKTACKLLVSTDLPIAEIAERCGYASSIHFARQFHGQTGKSPTAFRMEDR